MNNFIKIEQDEDESAEESPILLEIDKRDSTSCDLERELPSNVRVSSILDDEPNQFLNVVEEEANTIASPSMSEIEPMHVNVALE